jgi:hypothetical protein
MKVKKQGRQMTKRLMWMWNCVVVLLRLKRERVWPFEEDTAEALIQEFWVLTSVEEDDTSHQPLEEGEGHDSWSQLGQAAVEEGHRLYHSWWLGLAAMERIVALRLR